MNRKKNITFKNCISCFIISETLFIIGAGVNV